MARTLPFEMGGGQKIEIMYARGEGYIRSVYVRTRGGGQILAILVRTY